MLSRETPVAPAGTAEAESVLHFAGMWHASLTDPGSLHAQNVLRLQERAIATVGSGITIADVTQSDCPVVYCNAAFTAVTGYESNEVLGRNCRFLQGPDTDSETIAILRYAVRNGLDCTVTFKNYRKDRTPFWNELTLTPVRDDSGRLTHFIGVQHDVTARKEAEDALARANEALEARVKARTAELERANAQLRHDAFHDGLTDLANRALFRDRLAHALEREKRNPQNGFAVLYLDFDRFKVVNDSLGHAVGDQLLIAIAERLSGIVRPGDTVARLGGDEFTILLEDLADFTEATCVAERIHASFSRPFVLAQHEVHMSPWGDEFTILLEDLADFTEATCVAERIHASFSRPFVLAQHEVHMSASIGLVSSVAGYNDAGEVLRDADCLRWRIVGGGG